MPRLLAALRLVVLALLIGVWAPAHARGGETDPRPGERAAVGAKAAIAQIIGHASRRSGISHAYLVAQAEIESSLVPHAKARSSSATGLFQFLDGTWLETLQRHADRFDADYDPVIARLQAGIPASALDRAEKAHLLSLRSNPLAASIVAAATAGENAAQLETLLGRRASDTELYLAHFLGSGGAKRFLRAWAQSPHASAAQLLPAAARANRAVFYTQGGSSRSLQDIVNLLGQKIDRAKRRTAHLLTDHSKGAVEQIQIPYNQRVIGHSSDLMAGNQALPPDQTAAFGSRHLVGTGQLLPASARPAEVGPAPPVTRSHALNPAAVATARDWLSIDPVNSSGVAQGSDPPIPAPPDMSG